MKLWPRKWGLGRLWLAAIVSNALAICAWFGVHAIYAAAIRCRWEESQHAGSRLPYPSCTPLLYNQKEIISDAWAATSMIGLVLLVIAITVSVIRISRWLILRFAAAH